MLKAVCVAYWDTALTPRDECAWWRRASISFRHSKAMLLRTMTPIALVARRVLGSHAYEAITPLLFAACGIKIDNQYLAALEVIP